MNSQTALLLYWQQAFFREGCNQIDFQFNDTEGYFASVNDVLSGQLSFQVSKDIIWIGFEAAQRAENIDRYLVPLWIPASVDDTGKLCFHPRFNYPWIPSGLLDPLCHAPLLGLSPRLDEAWAQLFDEHEEPVDFSAYIEQSLKLIKRVAGDNWKDKIIDKGYRFLNKAIILKEVLHHYPVSPLLDHFIDLEEQAFQEEYVNDALMEIFHLYLGVPFDNHYLAEDDLKSFFHAALLRETQMLSIVTPAGSQKHGLIWNLMLLKCLEAGLADKPLPCIVYTGKTAPDFNMPTISGLLLSEDSDVLKSKLVAHSLMIKTGLDKIRAYYKGLDSKSEFALKIETLQKEDQVLEEKAESLNLLLNKWKTSEAKGTFFQKIWMLFSAGKRKKNKKIKEFHKNYLHPYFTLEDIQPLDEQMVIVLRAIKVQRTKLHNQLMLVTDSLTSGQGKYNQLVSWFKLNCDYDLALDDNITELTLSKKICEKFGPKLLQWIMRYWQLKGQSMKCHTLSLAELANSDFKAIDWLILDHAEQISPMCVATVLYRAKRLLAFGDLANQLGAPLIPRRMDDYEIKQAGLGEDDDALEDLQFKGMTSTSSVFELVHDKSAFKRMAAHGLLAQNEFKLSVLPEHANVVLSYANQSVYTHKLIGASLKTENNLPALGYYHVRTGIQNILLSWVKQLDFALQDVGIITLFEFQKQILKETLSAFPIEIKTIAESNGFSRKLILFVTEYNLFDKKPYIFDQGEQLFNRAFLCARAHFFVFGDMAVFDPKTHSPSGHVAKILFKASPIPLTFVSQNNAIQGAELHLNYLQQALKAEHALTIVSQGLDIKSIQKIALNNVLQRLRDNQVRVTLYIGTMGLMGQGPQSKAFKHQLDIFKNMGIAIFLVRNLHSNALWWDEHHYIEGQFPWLAGFGKLLTYPFVSVIGDDKLKTSFQSYLGVHHARIPITTEIL